METWHHRLELALRHREKRWSDLVPATGLEKPSVYAWKPGASKRTKMLEANNASKVCSFLGINLDWLLHGTLPSGLEETPEPTNLEKTKHPISHIPVVGTAQLGDNGYWAELEYPVGHGDGYIAWPSRSGNAYALRCRGDSMKPRIKDGEYVIVAPDKQIAPGDEVLVKAGDGRVMVKELLYIRDGMVSLLSINEAHGKLQVAQSDITAMHYVAGVVSSHLVDLEPPEPTKIEEPKPRIVLSYKSAEPDENGSTPPYSNW